MHFDLNNNNYHNITHEYYIDLLVVIFNGTEY